MKKQTKNTTDTLVPLFLTGAAGFVAFRRKSDWRVLIAVILFTFILSYALTSQITRRFYLAGPAQIPDGGGCDNYDATGLAARLYEDIVCKVCWREKDLYNELLSLTDCQLRKLYNAWNAEHYRKTSMSLPQAIASEGAFFDSDFGALQKAIQLKFSKLGLQ